MNPQPIGEMQEVPLLRLLVAGLIGVGANGQLNFTYPAFASGNGNAEVPSSAPIQPAQAFVNNVFKLTQLFGNLDMSSQGITHIDPDAIGDYATNYSAVQASGTTIDLSGNSLSSAEINAILAACVADSIPQVFTLNLSGGTNAAPSGQGITDKATLISAGWTVTTN